MKIFIWTTVVIVAGVLLGFAAWTFGWVEKFWPAVQVPAAESPAVQVSAAETYASSTMGISISYPGDYARNERYAYDQFGPSKLIRGVSFTIPAAMATGTNLALDTRISVEQLPRAQNCTGDIFLPADVRAATLQEASTTYSVASTSGAAAGNRYEETVFAIKGSKPCTAVRYMVHYGVLENYPVGEVAAFDRAALLGSFDEIRRSLALDAR